MGFDRTAPAPGEPFPDSLEHQGIESVPPRSVHSGTPGSSLVPPQAARSSLDQVPVVTRGDQELISREASDPTSPPRQGSLTPTPTDPQDTITPFHTPNQA